MRDVKYLIIDVCNDMIVNGSLYSLFSLFYAASLPVLTLYCNENHFVCFRHTLIRTGYFVLITVVIRL